MVLADRRFHCHTKKVRGSRLIDRARENEANRSRVQGVIYTRTKCVQNVYKTCFICVRNAYSTCMKRVAPVMKGQYGALGLVTLEKGKLDMSQK